MDIVVVVDDNGGAVRKSTGKLEFTFAGELIVEAAVTV
jgi:hypothetical protein